MSDTADPQNTAEQLDADKLPGNQEDPTAGGEYPPDEPTAVDDYGTTPAEERVPEPLEEREAREVPDEVAASTPDRSAEEDAMNLTEPPGMGEPGDGYIDPDESDTAP